VPNVKINFDPANMLLYDMGDPIRAVELLGPDIRSVHVKDANRPTTPGEWGVEVPLGQGQVNIRRFVQTLQQVATPAISTESTSPTRMRHIDVHHADRQKKEAEDTDRSLREEAPCAYPSVLSSLAGGPEVRVQRSAQLAVVYKGELIARLRISLDMSWIPGSSIRTGHDVRVTISRYSPLQLLTLCA